MQAQHLSRFRKHPFRQPRQTPRRQQLLPTHLQRALIRLKTLPLEPLLLRPILRRRHKRSPPPLPRSRLPLLKLPRCPRRQPRPLRPLLDRYNRSRHFVPHRHDFAISCKRGEDSFCIRFHAAVWRGGLDLWLYFCYSCCALGCA